MKLMNDLMFINKLLIMNKCATHEYVGINTENCKKMGMNYILSFFFQPKKYTMFFF